MSAAIGHPALRARISEVMAAYLAGRSARDVGSQLGVAATTVSRRGDELASWPADELLHLASRDHDLAAAVIIYLTGDPGGDARRVDEELVESLSALGGLISEVATTLRGDRHCDLAEARRLLPIVRDTQQLLTKVAGDLAEQITRGAK